MWSVAKDAIYAAIDAIQSALGYMPQIKTDVPHWQKTVEQDIVRMQCALAELRKLVGAMAFITCESGMECGTVAELIAAAKDIRDNPGTDAHGSVGFCAIELPKLDRLRDALAALDSSR